MTKAGLRFSALSAPCSATQCFLSHPQSRVFSQTQRPHDMHFNNALVTLAVQPPSNCNAFCQDYLLIGCFRSVEISLRHKVGQSCQYEAVCEIAYRDISWLLSAQNFRLMTPPVLGGFMDLRGRPTTALTAPHNHAIAYWPSVTIRHCDITIC